MLFVSYRVCIFFRLFKPSQQFVSSKVYVDHFISLLQYDIRNTFLDLNANHVLHHLVKSFYMLNIDRRDHTDTGIQYIHDILPTLFVLTAFDIGMSQFVNDDNFRMVLRIDCKSISSISFPL